MPRKGANGEPGARRHYNLTVDAETFKALVNQQDRLANRLGFKPSMPQVVRHIVLGET